MNIFNRLDAVVETDCPLNRHTWYGLGGPADYFIRPRTMEALAEVVSRCNENQLKLYVIGAGSNVLIGDEGVRGAVVRLDYGDFMQSEYQTDTVTVGAGEVLKTLVLTCVKKGLAGLETLTGIPGTVGGAVRMNAGGDFADIGSVVESVTLMDNQGKVFERSKPDLSFDFRKTNITAKLILKVQIKLTPGDPEQIMRTLQETWIHKKNHQPLNTHRCGSIFRDPRGQSAGALIDRAGLKGLQIGGAKVSEKHGNFIVAEKDCQSVDVLRLIEAVRERVREQFDIDLETNLDIW